MCKSEDQEREDQAGEIHLGGVSMLSVMFKGTVMKLPSLWRNV